MLATNFWSKIVIPVLIFIIVFSSIHHLHSSVISGIEFGTSYKLERVMRYLLLFLVAINFWSQIVIPDHIFTVFSSIHHLHLLAVICKPTWNCFSNPCMQSFLSSSIFQHEIDISFVHVQPYLCPSKRSSILQKHR